MFFDIAMSCYLFSIYRFIGMERQNFTKNLIKIMNEKLKLLFQMPHSFYSIVVKFKIKIFIKGNFTKIIHTTKS